MKNKDMLVSQDTDSSGRRSNKLSDPVYTALFIGFLIGIVIYSIAVNNLGFFTLIPLFFIYQLVKRPKR